MSDNETVVEEVDELVLDDSNPQVPDSDEPMDSDSPLEEPKVEEIEEAGIKVKAEVVPVVEKKVFTEEDIRLLEEKHNSALIVEKARIDSLERDIKERDRLRPKTQDETKEAYFHEYRNNPTRVISEINAAIQSLSAIPVTDAQFDEARQRIALLQSTKEEFNLRAESEEKTNSSIIQTIEDANKLVSEAVPDIGEKAPKLMAFAAEIGLDEQTATLISSPNTVVILPNGQMTLLGNRASQITIAISKLYDKINALQSAGKKLLDPPVLGRPKGSPDSDKVSEGTDLETASYAEYKKARMGKG